MNGMNELDATGVQFGQPQATQGQPHHLRAGPQRPAGAHWLRRRKGRFLHLFFFFINFDSDLMRSYRVLPSFYEGLWSFRGFTVLFLQVPIGFNRD